MKQPEDAAKYDNTPRLAARIVRKVLDDLLDRRGFRQTWDGCDQLIKRDIRRSLTAVVRIELGKKG